MKVYELMQLLSYKPSGAEVLIDAGDADGSWPAACIGYVGDKILVASDQYTLDQAVKYHEEGGAR